MAALETRQSSYIAALGPSTLPKPVRINDGDSDGVTASTTTLLGSHPSIEEGNGKNCAHETIVPDNYNWIARSLLMWNFNLVRRGWKTLIVQDTVPVLRGHLESNLLGEKLERYWNAELQKKKPRLSRAMAKLLWKPLLWGNILGMMNGIICCVGRPLVLRQLVRSLETHDQVPDIEALVLIVAVFLVIFLEGWTGVMYRHLLTENVGSMYIAGLFDLLLKKIVKTPNVVSVGGNKSHTNDDDADDVHDETNASNTNINNDDNDTDDKDVDNNNDNHNADTDDKDDITEADEVSMFGNDLQRTYNQMMWCSGLPLAVSGLISGVVVVVIVLGWIPALAGLSVTAFVIIANMFLIKTGGKIEHKTLRLADVRMSILTQIIESAKFIKYFIWEDEYYRKISKVRTKETKVIRQGKLVHATSTALGRSGPVLSAAVSVLAYRYTGNTLNAADVFAIVSVFQSMRLPMIMAPLALGAIKNVSVSLERLEKYLLRSDFNNRINDDDSDDDDRDGGNDNSDGTINTVSHKTKGVNRNSEDVNRNTKTSLSFVREPAPPLNTSTNGSAPIVSLKNVSLSWDGDTNNACVRDVTFDVERASLTAIVGAVGSGKSTLLHGLIGELFPCVGKCIIRASQHEIGYVPQSAVVISGSVIENVLFGRPLHRQRLSRALQASAFEEDLAMLPNGVNTEIGERGTTLSGGQQQRLGIARALYAEPTLMILDDPLSAVDTKVCDKIFKSAILGRGTATIVMVTNQLHLLNHCSHIVFLSKNRKPIHGTWKAMLQHAEFADWISSAKPSENGDDCIVEEQAGDDVDDQHEQHKHITTVDNDDNNNTSNNDIIGLHEKREAEPRDLTVGISLQKLKKDFKGTVAVEDVSLNVYKGQITALLGHNGAGKTTTMRMLCGMFRPSGGCVTVNGEDVATNTRAAQRQIGFCPQHDTLYDELTVKQHLWLFCCLRGAPSAVAEEEAVKMMKDLELSHKKRYKASLLSGGQRRRLSVGLALIGGSRVIVLDEPTTGMDPTARKLTWALLEKHKRERAMLVSTHFMDEADFIGDRVAIMAAGKIRCDGSSLFLKKHYGSGYKLTVLKMSNQVKSSPIIEEIRKFCAPVVAHDMGSELSLTIGDNDSDDFGLLFSSLDEKKYDLGVISYGCSITTLEDVFIKVGDIVASEQTRNTQNEVFDPCDLLKTTEARGHGRRLRGARSEAVLQAVAEKIKVDVTAGRIEAADVITLRQQYSKQSSYLKNVKQKISGTELIKSQWKAIFFKRVKTTLRDKYHLLMQLLPPILFTFLALIIVATTPTPENLPPRSMTSLYQQYGGGTGNSMSIWVTPDVSDDIVQTLQSQSGHDGVVQRTSSSDVSAWVLNQTSSSAFGTLVFNRRTPLIVGVDDEGLLIGWFNGQGYHTVAEAHAVLASAIYGTYMDNATISTGNDPFPRTPNERAKQQTLDRVGFAIAFAVMFGLAPLASSFAVPIVKEVQSKAKHLQYVSGIKPWIYWSATYALDVLVFMAGSFGSLILFPIFGIEAFGGERFFILWLMYVLYGLAIIPLMYLLSFLFKEPSVAFVRLTMLNVFSGLGALTVISVLDASDPESADRWRSIFVLLPNYNMAQAMNDIYTNFQTQQIVQGPCLALGIPLDQCCSEIEQQLLDLDVEVQVQCTTDYFRWAAPGIGQYLMVLMVQVLVFSALVWFVEQGLRFKSIINRKWASYLPSRDIFDKGDVSDVDVALEKESAATAASLLTRRDSNDCDSPTNQPTTKKGQVVLDHVCKEYRTGMFHTNKTNAVVNLSLNVPTGECFGLLGTNGAGKTTTFKLLTGDLGVSRGGAWVGGHSIMHEMQKIHHVVGYCPQFDALFDLLTGRETLEFFSRLQGIPHHLIAPTVNRLIVELGFGAHQHKLTKQYSGGTKRKLNTAIALLGDPSVVLLDEPTSGMDPVARQMLGKALLDVQEGGSTIMLTSHSMEECEALCSRMGILMQGHLHCLGSPQHLRSRFGDHFTVTFRTAIDLDTEKESEFWQMLQRELPGSVMKNCNVRTMQIGVPYVNTSTNERTPLGRVFDVFRSLRAQEFVDEFSVSEATLNQIFMDLATSDDSKPITTLEHKAYV
eukprot:m.217814 g.217814  ORF g.217814 m.217814 type:complete len:2091 (+) comp33245_c1_seq3:176-6448(+)